MGLTRETADGGFVGAPDADSKIGAGDHLVLYGRSSRIAELDRRVTRFRGDQSYHEAVAEQERVEAEERSKRDAKDRDRSRTGGPKPDRR